MNDCKHEFEEIMDGTKEHACVLCGKRYLFKFKGLRDNKINLISEKGGEKNEKSI